GRQELLTPIAKAWSTDVGVEVASMGVQVHGGMGFIEDTGAAQHYRDARIAPIYEGTNGVQAVDLAGRKLSMMDGALMPGVCAEIAADADRLAAAPGLEGVGRRLSAGVAALSRATDWMRQNRGPAALAGATADLRRSGDVIGGWLLARQALLAVDRAPALADSRAALARLFADQVLAQAPGVAEGVMAGGADLEVLDAAALAG
ncbi:MAG: acyl-CoA dehydrogenase, partial [Alphaproteobacteria bacterium]